MSIALVLDIFRIFVFICAVAEIVRVWILKRDEPTFWTYFAIFIVTTGVLTFSLIIYEGVYA